MPSDRIQWFPGHMAKTRRLISENLKDVDLTIELLDARIPRSSENPEIARLVASKPRLTLLSKSSLADPAVTELWKKHFAEAGRECIFTIAERARVFPPLRLPQSVSARSVWSATAKRVWRAESSVR